MAFPMTKNDFRAHSFFKVSLVAHAVVIESPIRIIVRYETKQLARFADAPDGLFFYNQQSQW
jgi:hypothetical protein